MVLKGSDGMLDITRSARKKVREIVDQEKTISPIRIMMAGGCIGPRLGMLFDSARPEDQVFEAEGIQYVIGNDLLCRFQPITVDYIFDSSGGRFSITSPKTEEEE